METQTNNSETPTTDTATTVSAQDQAAEGEAVASEVSVSVDGVEVSVDDHQDDLELTPVTGVVLALLLGLVAVAVARLRKK